MEFRILGPLEVSEGDRLLALPGPKARALLAILLIRRNQLVPTDQLIAELWGSEWPDTAGNAVHVYVSQLRRALTTAGGRSQVLQTGRKGYRLAVEPEAVDAERFEALAGLGVAALAREDFAHAERLLGDAVGLWRGPAFNDFPFERFAARERARLEERRLAALEDRFDALLALGRHADVTGELERIVDEHPLRERPHAQLMLALYRSGRQADALAAYRRIRTGLVEAAGVEPGPALRDLHHRILAQDPTLSGPNYNGRRMGRRRRGTPLPPARTTFVGRRRELLDVSALLAERRFPLLVLTGPGGVGKTRLALEAASRVADRFPDGVVLDELAVLRDSQSLLPTLAAALGSRKPAARCPSSSRIGCKDREPCSCWIPSSVAPALCRSSLASSTPRVCLRRRDEPGGRRRPGGLALRSPSARTPRRFGRCLGRRLAFRRARPVGLAHPHRRRRHRRDDRSML